MRRAGLSVAVASCVVAVAATAWAARPRYRLDVTFDRDARTAAGSVSIEVENVTAAPLAAVELWLHPQRLDHLPAVIDEHDFYWLYPRSFDAGGLAVSALTVDGTPVPTPRPLDPEPAGKGTLLVVPLPAPLPPGGRVTVGARFRMRIPHRYGSFGCHDDVCTLEGAFHPMLVALGPDGFDRTAPPAVADYDLAVAARPDDDVIIAGARRRAAHLEAALAATVVIAPRGRYRERTLVHRGVTVSVLHHGGPPSPPPLPGRPWPYLDEDRAGLVLAAVRDAIELLHEQHLDLAPGTRIALVETAQRMELAVAAAGCILYSDQLFRITPLDRFRKFHSFQLVRAVFDHLLDERLKARERPDDLGWSPDVAASWLVDLYTLRAYRFEEYARDVLRWVSFIPTIDRILYAPQIQFAAAYFNTLDEPDPTRDDLRRFANLRPRGKLLYEKLRDLLGDEGAGRVARATFAGTPLREAAAIERAAAGGGAGAGGLPLDAFFAQWLGPYPEVDYRFDVDGPAALPGGRWRYGVRVYKRGAHPPVEPVELRVTEWGGARHDLRWDGDGGERRFVVDTRRTIQSVELDPRGRLLEHLAGVNDDLRVDDRRPGRLKFLYNNFGALVNLQDNSLDLSIDFSLNRVFDVKNSNRFVLYRSPEAEVAAYGAYTRYFGRFITPARLVAGLTTALRVARLQASYGRHGEAPQPGTQMALSVGLAYDERFYVWEPWRATFAAATATYALIVQDSGRALEQVTVAAELGHVWRIVPGHLVAAEVEAAATFGDLAVPAQMLSAGAPTWLRGYEPDELLGRARLFGRLEYRHVFVHDLDLNFMHFLYVRGVAGALFAEGAAVSPCESYSLGGNDLFYDVGYSVRVLEDWFGVSQTAFNVDIAVPLVRRARGCFQDPGSPPPSVERRAPVGLFVYYGWPW